MSLPSGGDELNITGLLGVENDGFIHGVMHRGFFGDDFRGGHERIANPVGHILQENFIFKGPK